MWRVGGLLLEWIGFCSWDDALIAFIIWLGAIFWEPPTSPENVSKPKMCLMPLIVWLRPIFWNSNFTWDVSKPDAWGAFSCLFLQKKSPLLFEFPATVSWMQQHYFFLIYKFISKSERVATLYLSTLKIRFTWMMVLKMGQNRVWKVDWKINENWLKIGEILTTKLCYKEPPR